MIKDEIPFTDDGLRVWLEEAGKRMEQLKPYISEFNKLKNRVKVAQERISQRSSQCLSRQE